MPLLLIPFKGQGPYAQKLKDVDKDIKDIQKRINDKLGAVRHCSYIIPTYRSKASRSLTLDLHHLISGIS